MHFFHITLSDDFYSKEDLSLISEIVSRECFKCFRVQTRLWCDVHIHDICALVKKEINNYHSGEKSIFKPINVCMERNVSCVSITCQGAQLQVLSLTSCPIRVDNWPFVRSCFLVYNKDTNTKHFMSCCQY